MAAPNAIHEEFPDHADRIHRLKIAEGRFARLLQEHNGINGQVAGAESRQAPMSEDAGTDLRKRRVMLKDEIVRAISRA